MSIESSQNLSCFLQHFITFFFRKVRSWSGRPAPENFGCPVRKDFNSLGPFYFWYFYVFVQCRYYIVATLLLTATNQNSLEKLMSSVKMTAVFWLLCTTIIWEKKKRNLNNLACNQRIKRKENYQWNQNWDW